MATTTKPTAPRRRPAKKAVEVSSELATNLQTIEAVNEATPVEAAPAIAPTETIATETAKIKKAKKPKLIRDSFTIPQGEYAVLDELKARCLSMGVAVKKSELLRAGIITLNKLTDEELLTTIAWVERIKTGRPAK